MLIQYPFHSADSMTIILEQGDFSRIFDIANVHIEDSDDGMITFEKYVVYREDGKSNIYDCLDCLIGMIELDISKKESKSLYNVHIKRTLVISRASKDRHCVLIDGGYKVCR